MTLAALLALSFGKSRSSRCGVSVHHIIWLPHRCSSPLDSLSGVEVKVQIEVVVAKHNLSFEFCDHLLYFLQKLFRHFNLKINHFSVR